MMRFGVGVPEIRNARARDYVYAVAIEAVLCKEDFAFVHRGWRSVHPDCRRRRSLMSETWNIKFSGAANSESENPAIARFGRSCSRGIDDSSSAAPSHHQ